VRLPEVAVTLYAWKFIAPVVDDLADVVTVTNAAGETLQFEGYSVVVIAANVDEARAIAKTAQVDDPDDLLWLDVVKPTRMPINAPILLAWSQLS
jgi:response regulator of citrate/malate metabolism